MAQVKFDPALKSVFPYFEEEGNYGTNQEFEAQCMLEAYEFPSSENPAFDRDGEKGPYAKFSLLCVRQGKPNIRNDWLIETGQAWRVISKLDQDIIDDDGNYDTDDVAGEDGREICIVAGVPREGKNGGFFSKIKTILPA